MTSAELVFKKGFAPHLSDRHLEVLLAACEKDDPRLTQGSTTTPPPLPLPFMCVQNWPVESACALAFCGTDDFGGFCPADERKNPESVKAHAKVGEVEEFFAGKCFDADNTLGDPAACRHFLNWFDDTPRDEMRATLAGWCRDVLRGRTTAVTPAN